MHAIARRLQELGIFLPPPAAPAASYRPWQMAGGLLFVSGQLPMQDGQIAYVGRVGERIALAEAQAAARLCAINLLAQVQDALRGDWTRLGGCARLGGFVAAVPEFTEQHKVLNGASELLVEVLGDIGRHARAAVGVASLPLNAAVEVDGIFTVQ